MYKLIFLKKYTYYVIYFTYFHFVNKIHIRSNLNNVLFFKMVTVKWGKFVPKYKMLPFCYRHSVTILGDSYRCHCHLQFLFRIMNGKRTVCDLGQNYLRGSKSQNPNPWDVTCK